MKYITGHAALIAVICWVPCTIKWISETKKPNSIFVECVLLSTYGSSTAFQLYSAFWLPHALFILSCPVS